MKTLLFILLLVAILAIMAFQARYLIKNAVEMPDEFEDNPYLLDLFKQLEEKHYQQRIGDDTSDWEYFYSIN